MHQHVLLITADTALTERVSRALPVGVGVELHAAPEARPAPDWRGWALVLVDGKRGAALEAGAEALGGVRGIWLGPLPERTWVGPRPEASGERGAGSGVGIAIVDYLKRDEPGSKLAFVLRQHLLAAYMYRMRHPNEVVVAAANPRELQAEMNNALTGILGNAQLALDAGCRLPTALRQRISRIESLAGQMRERLAQWPAPEGADRMRRAA